MSNENSAFGAPPGPAPLVEVRYPIQQLLREVEYERRHSALGMELVDQSEIGAILARRRPRVKQKKNSGP
jgi:hypothetical protein